MSEDGLTTAGSRLGMMRFRKWEAFGIRLLFAWVVFQALPIDSFGPRGDSWFGPRGWFGTNGRIHYPEQPHPVGIAHKVDVTFMSRDAVQPYLMAVSILALISYVSGRGLIFSLPILTAIMIAGRTLQNSQGFTFHGALLVGFVLTIQTAVVIVCTLVRLLKKRGGESRYSLNDYLIRFTQVAIVAAYVVSGVSKLIESEGAWIRDSHYTGVYIIKTYRQNYHDTLDKEKYGAEYAPYAKEMLDNPNRTRLLMALGLGIELFCFIGLWNRWLLALTGIAVVTLHQFIAEMMNLYFPLNEFTVAIYFINPVFWIGALILWIRSPKSPAPAPDS